MMTNIEYLTDWHHATQSFIGMISLAQDMDKIKSILAEYKPKFKQIEKDRYTSLIAELGLTEAEESQMWKIVGIEK